MIGLRTVVVLVLLVAGCLYDPDKRCDEGQRVEMGFCVCMEGQVPAEIGCTPCPQHASAVAGTCQCDQGYSRTDDGDCEKLTVAPGDSCDPSAAEPGCPAAFPHCQPSSFDGGYCTLPDCSTDADCAGNYVCDDRGSPSYCARPPIGQGQACTTSADCAGTEATYCVTLMMGGCSVEGCSPPDVGCPPRNECCDLSDFGLSVICVPEGVCPQ